MPSRRRAGLGSANGTASKPIALDPLVSPNAAYYLRRQLGEHGPTYGAPQRRVDDVGVAIPLGCSDGTNVVD